MISTCETNLKTAQVGGSLPDGHMEFVMDRLTFGARLVWSIMELQFMLHFHPSFVFPVLKPAAQFKLVS